MILLNHRLGQRVRRTCYGGDYVLVEVATVPPLLICCWHAPSLSSGPEAYEESIAHLQADIEYLTGRGSPHGTRLVLCGDFNTQLDPFEEVVGKFVSTGERPDDAPRATKVLGLLQTLALKAFSTFSDIGFTRSPWPAEKRRGEEDSVIDIICASSGLVGQAKSPPNFPCVSTSDHHPIQVTLLAPTRDKKKRKKMMEALLQQYGRNRLNAGWEPTNPKSFKQELSEVQPRTLTQFAAETVQVAKRHTKYTHSADPYKQQLLQGLRNAQDPITRRAYQIELRSHARELKKKKEQEQLLKWALGQRLEFRVST